MVTAQGSGRRFPGTSQTPAGIELYTNAGLPANQPSAHRCALLRSCFSIAGQDMKLCYVGTTLQGKQTLVIYYAVNHPAFKSPKDRE
ncbi:hypothetical protein PISMIDRAFT_249097 [Pisolithus microcarpus 441]|uniref:Uncharacterized protein n=1 Tax=Pisolithus microcarpus 441 TaxID=765257 RepID=A0A0C9YSG2_9AGAM|nr:hypothetical protein PISMIDRAFT_249097 [Pisolithus microcarpus 441]